MKQKILLTLFIASFNFAVNAQKATTYAITGSQKGQNNWTEVRLVDISSGAELKTVFKNSDETQALNARTGKPVAKKDVKADNLQVANFAPGGSFTISTDNNNNVRIIRRPDANGNMSSSSSSSTSSSPSVSSDNNVRIITAKPDGDNNSATPQVIRIQTDGNGSATIITTGSGNSMDLARREMMVRMTPSLDKPFSTYSAACAYDKKHERLYYTPMGIPQLRYIDLKAKTPQVFYFEEEKFGALRNRGDVPNQITRMVIGANGNGYALTNNADHLIQFTTDKKAVFTDLGGLTDDPANGNFSVHNPGGYGGDIIAAKTGDLYLITANHNVFQIDVKNLSAAYKGTIQGLPRGYSTNGAAVEDGSIVLVNSSNSTLGYYHFDITKLVAEKVGNGESVFNASDLANANLLTLKQDEKPKEEPQPVVETQTSKEKILQNDIPETRLAVYPNPVTNHLINLVLDNYTPGKYLAKLVDVSGKQLSTKNFTINNKSHIEQYDLPQSIAKGNYLIQIFDQASKGAGVVKLVVQ